MSAKIWNDFTEFIVANKISIESFLDLFWAKGPPRIKINTWVRTSKYWMLDIIHMVDLDHPKKYNILLSLKQIEKLHKLYRK